MGVLAAYSDLVSFASLKLTFRFPLSVKSCFLFYFLCHHLFFTPSVMWPSEFCCVGLTFGHVLLLHSLILSVFWNHWVMSWWFLPPSLCSDNVFLVLHLSVWAFFIFFFLFFWPRIFQCFLPLPILNPNLVSFKLMCFFILITKMVSAW